MVRAAVRRIAPARVFAVLGIALLLASVVAIGRGAVALSPGELVAAVGERLGLDLGGVSARKTAILWSIRLPRVVLAIVVGSALASAGATLQGVVRNPLADPVLVGISGGAALGAIAWMVLGAHLGGGVWPLPAAAFAGALVTTALALALARVEGRTSSVAFLLGGVGLAALTGAGYGALLFVADDAALRSITFWSLGSVAGASWSVVAATAVPVALAFGLLSTLPADLDRLALGELEALHVGVDVERVIRRAVLAAALAVGACVATCGIIGFVGLVVPYLVRGVLGPGHRTLLPACAVGGAVLVVLADVVARTAVAPAEIPIGIVTAAAGAPVLLVLVRRGRGLEVMP